MPTNSKQTTPQTPSAPTPAPAPISWTPAKIIVDVQPDGGLQVKFLIEPQDAARLERKAYRVPIDTFLWENIIKPALSSALY